MKKARLFWLRRGAATIFVAACAVFFSACDNLAGIMEWPAHLDAGRYAVGGGDIGAGGSGGIQIIVTGIPVQYADVSGGIRLHHVGGGSQVALSGPGTDGYTITLADVTGGTLTLAMRTAEGGPFTAAGTYEVRLIVWSPYFGTPSPNVYTIPSKIIAAGTNTIPWSAFVGGGTGGPPGGSYGWPTITVTGIPSRYIGLEARIGNWVVPKVTVTSDSATFVWPGPVYYVVVLSFYGSVDLWAAYVTTSRSISDGNNVIPWSDFFDNTLSLTITDIPPQYDNWTGSIMLSGTQNITGDGFFAIAGLWWGPGVRPQVMDNSVTFTGRPWDNPVLSNVRLELQYGNYAYQAGYLISLITIGVGNYTIPWSDVTRAPTITVTGIPPEYHGIAGSINLSAPGMGNWGGYGVVLTQIRASTTFIPWNASPGVYDVRLSVGGLQGQASSRNIEAGRNTIPFSDFIITGSIPTFTVTFDGNGHTGGTAPNPISALSAGITLPDEGDLFRLGYRFEGWNTQPDGTGTHHFVGYFFTVTGNVTLYAQWVENIPAPEEFIFDWIGGAEGYRIIEWNPPTPVDHLIIPPHFNGYHVVGIADYVFSEWGLVSVTFPDSLVSIGVSAFQHNQLTSVVIPNSVTHIGAEAFSNNLLPSVVIPDSVNHIGEGAFANNWLHYVHIPWGVTYISEEAFANNWLMSVDIPWSVTYIGSGAFASNPLTSITIPSDVEIASPPWYLPSHYAMGIHGASFLEFYEANGRQGGTYTWLWNEHRWIFGDAGHVGGFNIIFVGFTSGDAGVGFDQSVSILQSPAPITVGGAANFDEIRWFHGGALVDGAGIVQGAYGETLDFSRLHRNRMGPHFVTVEVLIGGRWYNSEIRINVTR